MNTVNFNPFPVRETERLFLRQLAGKDEASIFFLRSDNTVNKYIKRPKQTNINEAREFITKINQWIKDRKCIYWAICLKDQSKKNLIGTICLWNFSEDKTIAELGYELHPAFQKQGLMNEAIKCILDYSFQNIGLKKMEAFTHKDNKNSTRLLLKNNFMHDHHRKDEGNSNNMVYVLTGNNNRTVLHYL